MTRDHGFPLTLGNAEDFLAAQLPPGMVEREAVESAVAALLSDLREMVNRSIADLDALGLLPQQKAVAAAELERLMTETNLLCATAMAAPPETN